MIATLRFCIAGTIVWASFLATGGVAATSEPALTLVSSASEASPDGIVTILLAGTNLPGGATITLYPPLKGDLWVAAPDCESAGRTSSLVAHATTTALLCLTSKKRQSVRAIATIPLADHLLVARSEPVKFVEDHWWSSPGFLTVFTTLLGAAAGVAGTLVTQRADHTRKIKDEAKALENEQASFVIRLLLPELAKHLPILVSNNQVQSANLKMVQSLPRKNLIATMDSERAQTLKSYFDARGNQSVVDRVTDYCMAADEYNDTVQGVKRETQDPANLIARGETLIEKLKALGFSA
jgi:hypothetical protein